MRRRDVRIYILVYSKWTPRNIYMRAAEAVIVTHTHTRHPLILRTTYVYACLGPKPLAEEAHKEKRAAFEKCYASNASTSTWILIIWLRTNDWMIYTHNTHSTHTRANTRTSGNMDCQRIFIFDSKGAERNHSHSPRRCVVYVTHKSVRQPHGYALYDNSRKCERFLLTKSIYIV